MTERILFVCTGNICRSPTAEGVFRKHFTDAGLHHVEFDSAGTHGYHVGEAPDPRSIKAAAKRGVDIATLRARKFAAADFDTFDLILALDRGHYQQLHALAGLHQSKVQLLLSYAGHTTLKEVPDPYYGSHSDFEHVLDLLEWAARSIITRYETHPATHR